MTCQLDFRYLLVLALDCVEPFANELDIPDHIWTKVHSNAKEVLRLESKDANKAEELFLLSLDLEAEEVERLRWWVKNTYTPIFSLNDSVWHCYKVAWYQWVFKIDEGVSDPFLLGASFEPVKKCFEAFLNSMRDFDRRWRAARRRPLTSCDLYLIEHFNLLWKQDGMDEPLEWASMADPFSEVGSTRHIVLFYELALSLNHILDDHQCSIIAARAGQLLGETHIGVMPNLPSLKQLTHPGWPNYSQGKKGEEISGE